MMNRFSFGFCCLSVLLLAFPAQAQSQPDLPVRVQLKSADSETTLRSSVASRLKGLTRQGWKEVGFLPPGNALKLKAANGQLRVSGLNNAYQALKLETPHDNGQLQTDARWYRGHLLMQAKGSHFSVINEVPLEQYLYSVVPSEMPASWPLEALKSQAVAARTYAVTHLKANQDFDVAATTASQVYGGVAAEHPRALQAVQSTRSQILTYQGQPIHAYFHSTSGGKTESGSDLWANFPYLQPVIDYDHASPKYTWQSEFSQHQLRERLKKSLNIDVGELVDLRPESHTRGGRVKTLKVVGTQGQRHVDGRKIRSALQLNSTFFNVGPIGSDGVLLQKPAADNLPSSFQFAGRGWGHGLGMSQWGARQLALNGVRYPHILNHYYPHTQITQLNMAQYRVASGL